VPEGILVAEAVQLALELFKLSLEIYHLRTQAVLCRPRHNWVDVGKPQTRSVELRGLLDDRVWQLCDTEPLLGFAVGVGHLQNKVVPAVLGNIVNAAHRPPM